MIHRLLALFTLSLLAAPLSAHAVGVGTTAPVSSGLGDLLRFADALDGNSSYVVGHIYPSFDLRFDEIILQIHALETIANIDDDVVYLGGNVWTPLTAGSLGGSWEAFGGVGGSVDLAIDSGDAFIQAGAIAPVGVRVGAVPRGAIYVQPGLYVASVFGDVELVADAQIMASIWL